MDSCASRTPVSRVRWQIQATKPTDGELKLNFPTLRLAWNLASPRPREQRPSLSYSPLDRGKGSTPMPAIEPGT